MIYTSRITIHKKIPQALQDAYYNWDITSTELAEKTGYHPVYIRRTLPRGPRPPDKASVAKQEREKQLQKRLDQAQRLADRPIKEIMEIANVSASTAYRIKNLGKTKNEQV